MMKAKKTAMMILASGVMFGLGSCLDLNSILASTRDHYFSSLILGWVPDLGLGG